MRIAACGQEMVLGGCFGFGGCAISLRSIRTAFGAISLRSIRRFAPGYGSPPFLAAARIRWANASVVLLASLVDFPILVC